LPGKTRLQNELFLSSVTQNSTHSLFNTATATSYQ